MFLANVVSVQSFCCRKYNNFIVWCRIPNFHYHGNKHLSMANFMQWHRYTVRPQRPTVWCKILHSISFVSRDSQFSVNIPNFLLPLNKGRSGVNFNDTVKLLATSKNPSLMLGFLTVSSAGRFVAPVSGACVMGVRHYIWLNDSLSPV